MQWLELKFGSAKFIEKRNMTLRYIITLEYHYKNNIFGNYSILTLRYEIVLSIYFDDVFFVVGFNLFLFVTERPLYCNISNHNTFHLYAQVFNNLH